MQTSDTFLDLEATNSRRCPKINSFHNRFWKFWRLQVCCWSFWILRTKTRRPWRLQACCWSSWKLQAKVGNFEVRRLFARVLENYRLIQEVFEYCRLLTRVCRRSLLGVTREQRNVCWTARESFMNSSHGIQFSIWCHSMTSLKSFKKWRCSIEWG